MSTAVRVGVDLNNRCSRKCAAPATLAPSSRHPTPPQTPTDAECTEGMYSVTTRRPPGNVVRRSAADASSLRWPRRRAPPRSGGDTSRLRGSAPSTPGLATAGRGIDRRSFGRRGVRRLLLGPQHQHVLTAVVHRGDLPPSLV